jgi:hypothetical protein
LLTNRVYPDDSSASSRGIKDVRQRFATLVAQAVHDANRPSSPRTEERRSAGRVAIAATSASLVAAVGVVLYLRRRTRRGVGWWWWGGGGGERDRPDADADTDSPFRPLNDDDGVESKV